MRTAVLIPILLVACGGFAAAANQAYFLQAVDIATDQGAAWSRCWNPNYARVNPGGDFGCTSSNTQVGFDPATRSCQLKWNSSHAKGYKGFTENIINDNGEPGEARHCVLDLETGTGHGHHIGYYFWAWKVLEDVPGVWQPLLATCAGAQDQVCLSSGAATTATGFELTNTPLGTIRPIGGFRPIPVPAAVKLPDSNCTIEVLWRLASSEGDAAQAPLYRVLGLAKTSCTPPTEAEFRAPDVIYADQSGTSLLTSPSDFGYTPDDWICYYFALRLVYPSAAGDEVASRFVSANSAGVYCHGFATEVYDLAATNFKNSVNVTWKTSLESGTVRFEVLRGYSEAGPFTEIGEILAAGEPSSYSFLDTTVPPAARKTAWYTVQAADASGEVTSYGPVLAQKKRP